MLHRQEILVNRLDELPPDADSERAYCRDMGIKSFLMLPMYSRDLIVGLIGVDAIQSERQWHEKDRRRLRLLGEILANALIRKRKDQEILKLKERLEAENIYLREEAKHSREQTDITEPSFVPVMVTVINWVLVSVAVYEMVSVTVSPASRSCTAL